ncbi:bifunctional DNA-formamidopyrimidine glycosylase/DNA-(apurinic or apyrimidinic site) lyase [Gluconacetobacter entanii]|uniref:bifunctional DNA-formamidopyrimidine glycosylase/DNA-(apurinic or apyrimidinic site) lyase n=1 Tax=Gluconacetobacter entanii TaxID=108528 RepID=UPI001C936D27|nr:bifunctional DNA-formamidopyrimidine glycosylase/DNA-(apurinic or apyrimidinic site) lyase [Gluconacetobacter entanii]MBY4640406.1 bifunctional DNA-formamidopyrimidine glycosylase/DNA-(apurinic or apyrimidinic site) lyase [Gluconacetobacter entanii]MCW4580928.1 bifunctional DNA-formamidopyrimidine glycosylase/DNA-(apurinic or apyrimidinic site) lyase [Gluconacetobacter entanii]MCW4582930.1 bifunctional DNA-formamidopyrimidine glycosylase/DNA-(apurinic or apyrimidinic site) lyase [Gluconacetob
MPELPEVETVMRGMRLHLEGHKIATATPLREGLRWPFPPGLADSLRGRVIMRFERRGKYILIHLDDGQALLMHLGMSGRVVLGHDVSVPAARHEHLLIVTEQGARCGLVDPRRFGIVDLLAADTATSHPLLARMGPEPLGNGFDAEGLARAARGRRTSVKALLLDQRVVAGLGNIYVSEALFRAGVHPERMAGSLNDAECTALVASIRDVLTEAIAAGGSSLRDYVKPDGELGYFQHAWRVYGRAGQGCPDCPGPPACGGVERIVQGGRSSFFCPRRQETATVAQDLS